MTGVTTESMSYSYGLLPGFPVSSRKVTILAGQAAIAAGTLMGKITASGKYIVSLAAASDGSQVPDMIAAHDIPAAAADQDAILHFGCRFNESALILGTGHTVASVKEGLRDKGIILEPMVTA